MSSADHRGTATHAHIVFMTLEDYHQKRVQACSRMIEEGVQLKDVILKQ